MVEVLARHFDEHPRRLVPVVPMPRRTDAVLKILEGLPWKTITPGRGFSARSGWNHDSFIMGRSQGVAGTGGFEKVLEREGKRYGVNDRIVKAHASGSKEALEQLWKLLAELAPRGFTYTSVQCHRNGPSGKAHSDAGNSKGHLALSLGSFTGGQLVVETSDPGVLSEYDLKSRPARIDLRRPHWVQPYQGTRYSVVWYSVLGDTEPLGSNRAP